MSRSRFLLRRVAFAALAIYLVVSASFMFFALTTDPGQYTAAGSPAGGSVGVASDTNVSEAKEQYEAQVEAYREANNLNDPVHVRYARWMRNMFTLQWGPSEVYETPVTTVLRTAVPATLTYVVPALLLSLLVGLGAGVVAALDHGGRLDRLTTVGAYVGLGVPDFYLGKLLLYLGAFHLGLFGSYAYGVDGPGPMAAVPVLTDEHLLHVILPTLVLTTSLLAAQVRYSRMAALEHVGSEFVRLVRAKGAGPVRVARHVVRNAAVLLVSLFFAETMAVLVMNVYVIEVVFGIQGLGEVSFRAIQERDVGLVLGTVLVFALVGVVGNLLQDVAYAFLDPRIDEE